jgi:hypothetical protein
MRRIERPITDNPELWLSTAATLCLGPFQLRQGAGCAGPASNGAACVTRTRDPIITNDVLYQLS